MEKEINIIKESQPKPRGIEKRKTPKTEKMEDLTLETSADSTGMDTANIRTRATKITQDIVPDLYSMAFNYTTHQDVMENAGTYTQMHADLPLEQESVTEKTAGFIT